MNNKYFYLGFDAYLHIHFDQIQLILNDTIQYDTRCYFNVHSKVDMSQLNLLHRNDN